MLFLLVVAFDGIPGGEWSNLPFLSETAETKERCLCKLEDIINEVVEPSVSYLDKTGQFPVSAINVLKKAGILGMISSKEVGGLGLREAGGVVRRLARSCGSIAMVTCMHYSATAVYEAMGPKSVRSAIAAGDQLATLALSESGSRSYFWAPVSTARVEGNELQIDACKSWRPRATTPIAMCGRRVLRMEKGFLYGTYPARPRASRRVALLVASRYAATIRCSSRRKAFA